MRVRFTAKTDGPGPSEAIVAITAADGHVEEVVVDASQIDEESLEIGHIVGQRNGHALVELPRESVSGKWRVWVSKSALLK